MDSRTCRSRTWGVRRKALSGSEVLLEIVMSFERTTKSVGTGTRSKSWKKRVPSCKMKCEQTEQTRTSTMMSMQGIDWNWGNGKRPDRQIARGGKCGTPQSIEGTIAVKPRLHDTTGCQTDLTTGLTTGLITGCIVYTNIYPVVKPVSQQVVSCKRGFS